MGVKDLESISVVKLFWINEMQEVIEDDSPAPGAKSVIARKDSVYEYFHSLPEAQFYVDNLRTRYKSQNKSLKVTTLQFVTGVELEGVLEHDYSHYFRIYHEVKSGRLAHNELPDDIEELLKNPQRRITKDERIPVTGLMVPIESELPYKFTLF